MTNTNKTKMEKVKAGAERLTGILKSAAHKGKTAWKVTKAGVKTAAAVALVGTGVHVYNQFHKTPEEAHKDTVVMKGKVEKEMDKLTKSNTVARTIAGAGASHGGALREWIIRHTNTK